MAHNRMNPVRTCKEGQCILYLEDNKWVNAVVKAHLPDYNETEIIIRGKDWKREDMVRISSDRVIDDCTAPLFQ